jgi:CoA:oxalate CoA-transferase
MTPPAAGPLRGVRILELSRVIAGPYMARVLADLGADVIKVESPEGDQARQIAPKWDRGMSGMFTFANVGKRGICIDFKAPGAIELMLRLVAHVDVVTENFRPGVVDRLGLGWDAIRRANPRAILVSINGFGSDSSLKDRRAYAQVVHAAAGLLHDQASYAGSEVQHIAQAYGDTTTGLHSAIALLAALRERDASGEGQHVELSIYDAVLATYTETIHELRSPAGREDGDDTNGLYDAGPHGQIAVAGAPQHIWHCLRRTYDDLADPAPGEKDVPTKARLRREVMEQWMAERESRQALIEALERAGIACSPVETLQDALRGPFGRERGVVAEVDDRRGGTRDVVNMPYRFSRNTSEVGGSAPRRGEHNGEVLRELLGLGEEEIRDLTDRGILEAAAADER